MSPPDRRLVGMKPEQAETTPGELHALNQSHISSESVFNWDSFPGEQPFFDKPRPFSPLDSRKFKAPRLMNMFC
jgi:hypothetical protein